MSVFLKLLRHFEPSLLPQGLYLFVSAHSKHLHAVFVDAEHRTDRRRKTESHGNIRCTFRDYDYSAYLWHTLSKYYRAFSPASGCFDRTRCLGYTRAAAAFLLIRSYNLVLCVINCYHHSHLSRILHLRKNIFQSCFKHTCLFGVRELTRLFFLRSSRGFICIFSAAEQTGRLKNRKSKYYKNRIQDRSQFLILFKCFCKHRKYRISVFHLYLRAVIFAFPHIILLSKTYSHGIFRSSRAP